MPRTEQGRPDEALPLLHEALERLQQNSSSYSLHWVHTLLGAALASESEFASAEPELLPRVDVYRSHDCAAPSRHSIATINTPSKIRHALLICRGARHRRDQLPGTNMELQRMD